MYKRSENKYLTKSNLRINGMFCCLSVLEKKTNPYPASVPIMPQRPFVMSEVLLFLEFTSEYIRLLNSSDYPLPRTERKKR